MDPLRQMDEYDKRIIRTAMLNAQSEWLTEADGADTRTARTIAVVIADAFSQEAEKYKTKETKFYDLDGGTLVSGTGSAWDVEHGVAPALPEDGETRGEPRHSA